jgi:hypothetical protein
MIIRLTKKLAGKLHEDVEVSLPLNPAPLLDWSAALFLAGRAQYILLMNTQSLYSVVMRGAGISDARTFRDQALANIRDTMLEDGFFLFHARIAPHADDVAFSKTISRSATGSLNELVYQAWAYLSTSPLSLRDTACRLNEMPMSAIGYRHPLEEFKKLAL